jgi:hypothetical protein
MGRNRQFAELEALAIEVGDKHDFKLASPFGERHGSWEITFLHIGNLNYFVSIALSSTTAPPASGPATFKVEFWAGADDGVRFVRRLISQLSVSDDQLSSPSFREMASKGLGTAMDSAVRLGSGDLADTYLPEKGGRSFATSSNRPV